MGSCRLDLLADDRPHHLASRATNPMPTILETAQAAGAFGTLLAAVDAAGLRDALEGPGPFTVFAPIDAAFAALPPAPSKPSSITRPNWRGSSSTT